MNGQAVDVETVTPCVGVWIETVLSCKSFRRYRVTPCVGVWIETLERLSFVIIGTVTPCVGVWIETIGLGTNDGQCRSHPAWVCGLKHGFH